jgi:hypothetical protein
MQCDPLAEYRTSFVFKTMPNGWLVGRFEHLELLGIPHLITTKIGPDPYHARYQTGLVLNQIAGLLGLSEGTYLNQVHGGMVLTTSGGGLAGQADGLCTTRHGLLLGAKSGDCPIVLVAEIGRAHV